MRALTRMEVDQLGLDAMDRRYLMMIADIYRGGPVGVETLAAGLSEPRDTIEEVIEPYLIQLGLIARTARGRCLNGPGWTHLGLPQPKGQARPVRRQMKEGQDEDGCYLALGACSPAAPGARRSRRTPAPRRPAAVPDYADRGELALPARPRRQLRAAAADDGAQPRRLWREPRQAVRPPIRRSTASTSIRPSRAIPASTAT